MKKRIFLLLLLGMHALLLTAQDYRVYHTRILEAESLLGQERFQEAGKAYEKIFGDYRFVFAKDAYNACQVAALTGDSHLFEACLYQCARSGVPMTFLQKNALIVSLLVKNFSSFETRYLQDYQLFENRIDKGLRKEFSERFQREQASKGKPDYKNVVYENFNRILALAKMGRFPGEHLIGSDKNLESACVFATLYHYPYSYLALKPYLTEGLQKGWVPPFAILYLYGFNQSRTSVLYTRKIPYDTSHFKEVYNTGFSSFSSDTAEVNKQRKRMYVQDLTTMKQIKTVSQKHGIDFLLGY